MAKIVVMDDEATVRNVIERLLKREGHEVLAFEDAAPALEEVDFNEIDLVITDLVMPTPGDQFILIMQEDEIEVPIIVLSAHLTDARTDYLRELGVTRILEKPFEVAQMLEAVNGALG
ncbi:MAG: response regulator [Candidatus Latescibacteria bacterium]|jgi:DNA-binding NtrC family response regulator|nr:response regulator [Candidatus Latescibacterota bacterium]